MNGIENEGQDRSNTEDSEATTTGKDNSDIETDGSYSFDTVDYGGIDEAVVRTSSVKVSTNGASTTLHYPIVTRPKARRKASSVQKPIPTTLHRRSDHKKSASFSATLKRKTKEFLGRYL